MSNTTLQKTAPDEMANAEVTRGVTLSPRVDILENENELLLIAEMPGVKQDSVDVRFEKGELTLHGRRTLTPSPNGFYHCEIDTMDYFRSFMISEQIDAEKIWAELKHGVLTLHLPKAERAKPRKIAVKDG